MVEEEGTYEEDIQYPATAVKSDKGELVVQANALRNVVGQRQSIEEDPCDDSERIAQDFDGGRFECWWRRRREEEQGDVVNQRRKNQSFDGDRFCARNGMQAWSWLATEEEVSSLLPCGLNSIHHQFGALSYRGQDPAVKDGCSPWSKAGVVRGEEQDFPNKKRP